MSRTYLSRIMSFKKTRELTRARTQLKLIEPYTFICLFDKQGKEQIIFTFQLMILLFLFCSNKWLPLHLFSLRHWTNEWKKVKLMTINGWLTLGLSINCIMGMKWKCMRTFFLVIFWEVDWQWLKRQTSERDLFGTCEFQNLIWVDEEGVVGVNLFVHLWIKSQKVY